MNTELLCRLPLEQARCRELVRQFQAMGSIGHFAAALVEAALRRADRAIIEGDEAAVREALAELEAFGRRAADPTAGRGGAAAAVTDPTSAPTPAPVADAGSPDRRGAPCAARRGVPLRPASPEADAFTARWPSVAVRAVPPVGRRPARPALAA